jgi:hypothetical protein
MSRVRPPSPGARQFEVILEALRTFGVQGFEPVPIATLRLCLPSDTADHDLALGFGYGLSHSFLEFVASEPHGVELTPRGRARPARDE